jgi:beta-lactamase class A
MLARMPRRRALLVLAIAALPFAACAAPRPLQGAESELQALAAKVRGTVGIYVRDLATGDEVAIAADEPFPTASLVKLPILGALFAKVDRGELAYHQELTYTKDRLYPGEDLLGSFADGQKVALDKVAMLMITTSDNTASLWCQELAGTGTAINGWLAAHGCAVTRVNSRTPGREAERAKWGWGVTTPREMADLLVQTVDGRFGSAAACDEARRALARIYWDGEALSALPPDAHALSKQGAIDRSRSEVVLVHAPRGDYAFCVITKDQQDASWGKDNEGFVLLREVSAALWRRFAPLRPYAPPAGSERF